MIFNVFYQKALKGKEMSNLQNLIRKPAGLTLFDENVLKKTLDDDLTTSKKPLKRFFWLTWQVRTVS